MKTLLSAAILAVCASGTAAATFTFVESPISVPGLVFVSTPDFTPTQAGPVLGPNGAGGPSFDAGAFGAGDVATIIGLVSAPADPSSDSTISRDTFRFTFSSPFKIDMADLGIAQTLEFVQLFDDGGASVARQDNLTVFAIGPLFNGDVFGAGTYALRLDGNANTTLYTVEISAVPLPAPALLLMVGMGALAFAGRRA